MPKKKPSKSNKSYVISVSYATGIYRHIKIADDATLYNLHQAIQDAFIFDDDHAHAFFLDNRSWSHVDSYFADMIEGEEKFTSDYVLNKVLHLGQSFKYIFDFGDEFTFQCKLLKEIDEITEIASVIRSKGDAPKQYSGWDDDDDEDDFDDIDDEDDDIPFDAASDDEDEKTILYEFPE
ncbi:MAG: IS1096 element passenger TnpR family protein [Eubacteriales bacterium]